MTEKRLILPLTREDTLGLQLRDIVYLSGVIMTGAAAFHRLVGEKGVLPPLDFSRINVLMHTTPLVQENGGYKLVGLTPTSSRKLEKLNPIVIRKLKLRAIIGKTTVGPETMRVMQEVGCVHLTTVGTPGAILARRTRRVLQPYLEKELGRAACVWTLEVADLGPFLVDVDARGNNLFQQLEQETEERMKELYRKYSIPDDFRYSMMD